MSRDLDLDAEAGDAPPTRISTQDSSARTSDPGLAELRESFGRHQPDRSLVRFLDACDGDVEAAKRKLKEYCKCWEMNKWDRTTYTMIREQHLRRMIVCPPDMVDKQGRHTVIFAHGLYVPKEGSTGQNVCRMLTFFADWISFRDPDASKSKGLNFLVDLAGFGRENWDWGLISMLHTGFRATECVPFREVRIVHVNATCAFCDFWSAAKAIWPRKFREKCLFFRNGAALQEEFDPHMIPESLGGTFKIDMDELEAMHLAPVGAKVSANTERKTLPQSPRRINFTPSLISC